MNPSLSQLGWFTRGFRWPILAMSSLNYGSDLTTCMDISLPSNSRRIDSFRLSPKIWATKSVLSALLLQYRLCRGAESLSC